MTVEELIQLRKSLGLSQADMAAHIGMTVRPYQDIEHGKSALRKIHALAAERAALDIAIERKNPMLAPAAVRKAAIELTRIVTEG